MVRRPPQRPAALRLPHAVRRRRRRSRRAVVDLAEGPRMMTEVVGCGEGALRVGMALEVAFRAEEAEKAEGEGTEGAVTVAVPVFRPASA
ncbi:OB-fold domain-containing protein [Streptomyces sp. GTA36]